MDPCSQDMFRAVVVCLELHDLGALLRVVSDPAFEKRAFDAQPVRDADGEAGVPDDWALVAAMHVAAAQGDMAVVQWLLKLVRLRRPGRTARSPLRVANASAFPRRACPRPWHTLPCTT